MTEQDVLKQQEENGQKVYFLILIGTFLHAYGHGAFALSRATGFRVMRRHRKAGDVLTAGFPAARIDDVRRRVLEAGGMIDLLPDGKTWMFSGLDGTPDDSMVCEPASANPPATANPPTIASTRPLTPITPDSIVQQLLDFPLSTSTPLEAMMFLGNLQKLLRHGTE